mmetsp:Transcript_34273/g.39017  ORF Transcript_34273/g.39017 Transcript_34273/m.39017 type:complete len:367 (-) Transcript_34273:227-1327(-)|eukprot:CAMPEP_0194139746 /NCGR_PEP_ID=MMETSP0152-20130528/9351_1 /TAXON_ID=1049557 /ORGANISM="Thalassiothrix antarctica, Strain L6-D1" /LENGTH=366 /DNA_ID=CAMNT_0038837695 /DNA_START=57 /DNA_END=1157 /DNA_ORIENTATION=-
MITKFSALLVFLTVAIVNAGKGITVGSTLGRTIMQNSRSLEGNQNNNYEFLEEYSIKFQGCHHVSQWNADADDEDDVRIKTKRLVRFRLCPTNNCQNDATSGCTSKFGDYVVDLNTFVAAYLQNIADNQDSLCADVADECAGNCNNGDDADCMYACYSTYNMDFCVQNDDDNKNDDFDALDYAECAQYDLGNNRRKLEDGYNYYLGPYCADQGGQIHLGLFSDDTCTTFVNNGDGLFYDTMGYQLPYVETSLVSDRCISCAIQDDDGNAEVNDVCTTIYQVSGKCETKMNVEYPNESACTYIEGIKIIREDGVIRTSSVKKSKAAAVSIGLFLTVAVLLSGYVYYLRTKLGRAKINLSAASQAALT